MAHLGEFGRAVKQAALAEPDTFSFYGEWFDIPGDLSALVLMEFAHAIKQTQAATAAGQELEAHARRLLDRASTDKDRKTALDKLQTGQIQQTSANTDATVAMYAYVRACIGETQWERFRGVVLKYAVDADELMDVCAKIYEAVSGRPTSGPSTSSDGPSNTGDGSPAGSASPAGTPGPQPPATDSQEPTTGVVVEMTAAQRQRAEFAGLMQPVEHLLSSG